MLIGFMVSCTKEEQQPALPQPETQAVSNITATTARSGVIIAVEGDGEVTAGGICWSTAAMPTVEDDKTNNAISSGTFGSQMTGLTPNTPYFVRSYATTVVGTAYGEQLTFTTQMLTVPTVSTTSITITGASTASGEYAVNESEAEITSRGICWNTTGSPTIANSKTTDGSGSGTFTSSMTGLVAGTIYFGRAYATNSVGTSYGNEIVFGSIVDVENTSYNPIAIGTQVWLKENLNTYKYRNGDVIPLYDHLPAGTTSWSGTSSGAVTNYPLQNQFGRLYNWYAVTDPRGLCPVGWHVPTETEWATLVTFLGGVDVAGGPLKQTGTALWHTNVGATNSSGFTALPGGHRTVSGTYQYVNQSAIFWTSTAVDVNAVWSYSIAGNLTHSHGSGNHRKNGFSVRCIRD